MKVNISIDDVSPHPKSSTKVLESCYELIKLFPDIKFTLFVPIAYWRTIKTDISTDKPLCIDEYPEFCKTLSDLPDKNFEICYHGLNHGIPGKSDNDEFQHLTYDQAVEKFNVMQQHVIKAGLAEKFKPIFRPPAWRMSGAAIRASKTFGIKILALSPEDYALQTYQGEHKNFDKVVYYDYNPPYKNLASKDKVEVVYHACEWDKNYLSKDMSLDLAKWLREHEKVEFCFIGDLND